MKLLEIINKAIMVICAVACAFCIGYAITPKEGHVLVMAAFYGLLASLIRYGIKMDRKREELIQRQKLGRN